MNVLFVFEFGPGRLETMTDDYVAGLSAIRPDMRAIFFHGFLREYVAGGIRPVRILNAMYMYARLPFVLAARRPDMIVVRTTPPGIQLWCTLLGLFLRIRVGTWMMDYHPEIEARALAHRPAFRWLAILLRKIDAYCLRRMAFGIVLDDAMEHLIRSRAPQLPLVKHPTWNTNAGALHEPAPTVTDDLTRELRLVYAGNLGYSHPLETLEALLTECASLGDVRLFLVGVSLAGQERFRALAERTSIALELLPRTPFEQLGETFHQQNVHAGIVVLSNETAGLVSPSKFGAYIRFGLATLYVGPSHTSSEAVCVEFGAGFAIHNGASTEELRALARRLRHAPSVDAARENSRLAAEYFGSKSGVTLAKATARLIFGERMPNGESDLHESADQPEASVNDLPFAR